MYSFFAGFNGGDANRGGTFRLGGGVCRGDHTARSRASTGSHDQYLYTTKHRGCQQHTQRERRARVSTWSYALVHRTSLDLLHWFWYFTLPGWYGYSGLAQISRHTCGSDCSQCHHCAGTNCVYDLCYPFLSQPHWTSLWEICARVGRIRRHGVTTRNSANISKPP